MSQPKILACGEVLWDLFPDGECFGGAPANFACHAATLGGRVSILSAVGNDRRGDEALGMLQAFGVEIDLVQRIPDAPTGSVGVAVDSRGKPSFEIHADSAWDRIAWSLTLEEQIASLNAIYFGTLGQRSVISRTTIQHAMKLSKAHGILRVLDVNLRKPYHEPALIRESISQAGVLKLSDDELPEVAAASDVSLDSKPEFTLRSLLNQYALDYVVMTRGAEGALLVSATETVDQPEIPVQVVDTVGAGDAFVAALVLGLLRRDAIDDILRKACEAGSAVCSQSGAMPSRLDQAQRRIALHNRTTCESPNNPFPFAPN